jgi:hypothetical protein
MSKRDILFKGRISLGKIDWFAKLLYNACGDDIELVEVSGERDGVVLSLRSEHIDAIANEATTYVEMEDNVIKIIDDRNNT